MFLDTMQQTKMITHGIGLNPVGEKWQRGQKE
jgi:hypothetical protein